METNDIKDIWRSGVDSKIKSYSDYELNEMVIESARKSMKAIQLGGIFQLVVIAVMIYLILTLFFRDNSLEMKLLDFTGLLILFVCSVLWKRSDYKMNKYKYDMPVKEWLEYRIHEIDKTISTKKKYNILIMCLAFLLGFGFHVVHQIILKAPFNPILSGSILVGLIIYFVIVARSLNTKYRKTLEELKELYQQFEESN
jgi:multisubunit Na+/H+ antiporter MnhB subunit